MVSPRLDISHAHAAVRRHHGRIGPDLTLIRQDYANDAEDDTDDDDDEAEKNRVKFISEIVCLNKLNCSLFEEDTLNLKAFNVVLNRK